MPLQNPVERTITGDMKTGDDYIFYLLSWSPFLHLHSLLVCCLIFVDTLCLMLIQSLYQSFQKERKGKGEIGRAYITSALRCCTVSQYPETNINFLNFQVGVKLLGRRLFLVERIDIGRQLVSCSRAKFLLCSLSWLDFTINLTKFITV